MIDYDEVEKEKKLTRVFYKTANIAGYGVGCFVLAFLMPFINRDSVLIGDLAGLFVKYGWMALGCVALMMATFMFSRKHVMMIHQLLYWLILPTIAIMLAFDVFTVFTKDKELTTNIIEIPISGEGLGGFE